MRMLYSPGIKIKQQLASLKAGIRGAATMFFSIPAGLYWQKLMDWRRERDSNPRAPFGANGFQDRRFQPLTHPSRICRYPDDVLHHETSTASAKGGSSCRAAIPCKKA